MIERLQLPREQNGIAFTIGDQKRRNKIVEQVGQTEPIDEVEENNQEKEPMSPYHPAHFAVLPRTDNEIKNYWNIKDSLGLAYLFYPPEIQKEIDLRDIHLQQKEDIENQLQISPSSSSSQNKTNHDSALITPLLSIEAAKNYNDKFIATSSSNSHQARTTISFSSSSSLDENPDFSLIDPMKYPLMYASLYHPSKILLGDSNGKAIMAPPPPSIIIPSNNSPHITPMDQTPITLFENQIMDPEFFLERNNGTLGDLLDNPELYLALTETMN
ncbi:hypothetical protein Tco_1074805 [Tanacetum coccineum]